MKRWLVASISLLALTLSLALGYFLPGGIVALTNNRLSDSVWEYKVQELELKGHPLSLSGTLTLADKLELMCSSPFSLAYLPQGHVMDAEQIYSITTELVHGLFETEPFLNIIYLQPCVAFFSEKQSFLIWAVCLEFHNTGVMQLYLDDATGAILMLHLEDPYMTIEEMMPNIFEGDYDGYGQDKSPSELLADRMIAILEHGGGMTVTAYNQKTGVLEVSVDGENITTSLFANVSELGVIFNPPSNDDYSAFAQEIFIYP